MGISHCYASPILRARAGSQHGYDITDHNEINPEIGTEEEFAALVRELKSLGMGLILDIVPNHMGVGHGTNPWWQNVLENGEASEYADYFDIDWRPLKTEMHGKVLLPVLGDSYGEVLERGELKLGFENGSFHVSYYDKRFPIDPTTYAMILEVAGDAREFRQEPQWKEVEYPELQVLLRGFQQLPSRDAGNAEDNKRRQQEVPQLKRLLSAMYDRSDGVRELVQTALERCTGNTQDPHSYDALHRVLESQAYRLAHWRVSAEEINYRRFFDVNDLVGLRMENPKVFADTHKLLRKLLAESCIDGLRLDHPDGLFNPVQYFTRVQILYAAANCCGSEPSGRVSDAGLEEDVVTLFGARDLGQQAPLYMLVEKILEHGEQLPNDWPVDGTVGYEFGNALTHVFINSRTQRLFTNIYHRFIDGAIDVNTLIYESKMLIMRSSLSSEVTVLTHLLEDIANTDRRARDFTRALLKDVIRETIACFPVYRTYIDARGTVSERDRGYIVEAIARAKRRNQNDNPAPFDFLRSVLLLEPTGVEDNSENYRKRLGFAMKFQQLSGPVMAKGLEDTACYVYSRFISANEVGGSPAQFGISLDEFHHSNLERAEKWPHSMLTTSTHDSKRSEDVRARLNVLSEMPKEWSSNVIRWRRANRSKKRTLADGRVVPDANEEYFLYQTLIGAWPLEWNNHAVREDFIRRMQEYMTKAVHEAKVNLSWISQNQEYVDALTGYVERILTRSPHARSNTFLQQIEKFLQPVKMFGFVNALAQVLLKLTAPGVPDIYRGNELWDFSLVDPDNRRPVDYDVRESAMAELLKRESDSVSLCREMMDTIDDGRAKLWTTMRALRFRREHVALFRYGSYLPLFASEDVREHVVAFSRRFSGLVAVSAVPRFPYKLMGGRISAPLGSECWKDSTIEVPEGSPQHLRNLMTDEVVQVSEGRVLCREVFANFPVALLTNL